MIAAVIIIYVQLDWVFFYLQLFPVTWQMAEIYWENWSFSDSRQKKSKVTAVFADSVRLKQIQLPMVGLKVFGLTTRKW